MTFSATDKLKAIAVVSAFETGAAFGKFSTVAVLDDGAGISYGFSQFTHRSGTLAAVLERYIELGGAVGKAVIEDRMPIVGRRTVVSIKKLSVDVPFRNALRAAGITDEMKQAQVDIALERFIHPGELECLRMGFTSPLALAVIHDSMVHGSYERLRAKVRVTPSGATERSWITEYVTLRDRWLASIPRLNTTRYRTRFFLSQIKLDNWTLTLPVRANGVTITDAVIDSIEKYFAGQTVRQTDSAVGPQATDDSSPSTDTTTSSSTNPHDPLSEAQPPDRENEAGSRLDAVEKTVDSAAAKYDQVERIATTAVTRNDAAKSLWTTVIGSVTQTFWALFGLLAGVPREVWLAVAIIAGALMLMYLYRQIALGKIREQVSGSTFHVPG
jgi:hypothetical protein